MEGLKKFNFNFNNLVYKFFNSFDNMQHQKKVECWERFTTHKPSSI